MSRAERDAAILADRKRGDSLREIAPRYGISSERVRQVLAHGEPLDPGQVARARAERRRAAVDAKRDDALAAYRAGEAMKQIAIDTGLSANALVELIRRHATDADRAARHLVQLEEARRAGSREHSTDEVIAAVGQVAHRLGRVPTGREYDRLARAAGLPRLATVIQRCGTWHGALREAGFTPAEGGPRGPGRRWTEQACLEALRELVGELGWLPPRGQYDALYHERLDLPSSATIRTRLGAWSQVAHRIYAADSGGDQSAQPSDPAVVAPRNGGGG